MNIQKNIYSLYTSFKKHKLLKTLITAIVLIVYINLNLIAEEYVYPYADGISKGKYQERRTKLLSQLSPAQMHVAFSYDHFTKTEYMTVRQSSNLNYLTGAIDSKTILLLLANGVYLNGEKHFQILFIENQTEKNKLWNGLKMDKKNAVSILGFEKVMDYSKFDSVINLAMANHSDLLVARYTKGKHFSPYKNSKYKVMELNIPLIELLKEKNPYLIIEIDKLILQKMRAIKDEEEIQLIQKAIDITIEGHKIAMLKSKVGMFEYEIESLMEGEFQRLGAENNGYNSIVGTGRNTCYLHYTSSRSKSKDGDLILMDCGAEYHAYTADITRTFPINGKFSEEQKIIYNIVLDAQMLAISHCREGQIFKIADSICKEFIGNKLVEIGLLKDKKDYKKYFPHGTSHYLGLDVHDVGPYTKLEIGNIITVEPGIYIPEGSDCDPKWWNIGVRIEDDILITKDGSVNLSKALPRTIKEIEELLEKRNN